MHYILRIAQGANALNAASRYFVRDNIGPTRPDGQGDDWLVVDRRFFRDGTLANPAWRSTSPVASSGSVAVLSSPQVMNAVLTEAGARPKDRDREDREVISDVQRGTGRIIDCVGGCAKNAGGWPSYAVSRRTFVAPANPHSDDDRDGYTNLEEDLHRMAAAVE